MYKKELDPREKITYGRIKLDDKYPFYSHLAYQLKVKESKQIPTMGVNKFGVLSYNKEFVENTKKKHLLFLLTHEVLHVSLMHTTYCDNMLQKVKEEDGDVMWHKKVLNWAADYVVNGIMKDEGYSIKNFEKENFELVYSPEFRNKSIEQVYHELLEKDEDDPLVPPKDISLEDLLEDFIFKQSDDELENGDKFNMPVPYGELLDDEEENDNIPKGEIDGDELDKFWERKMYEAYKHMNDRGDESSFVKELIENLHKEKINWKNYLRKEIRSLCKNRYNTVKPSRRGMVYGYNLPSIEGKEVNITVALDTSGSMTSKQLSDALSEIKGMLSMDNDVTIKFIMHDSQIKEIKELSNNNRTFNKNKFQVIGRGGTDHRPVFKWIEKNKRKERIDTVILFTDGYTMYPNKKPSVRTIWVMNSDKEPPFGDVIYME